MLRHLRRRRRRSTAGRVDLFLGPDVSWVLKTARPEEIRRVIAYEGPVLSTAQHLGLETLRGDANTLDYEPSDIALSVHYPLRIRPDLLSRYRAAYNLHPGYLPWCRGLSSVSWALWEGAPAGATLHEMTATLDGGPIVERVEVEYGPHELYGEVQKRVFAAERELLGRYWPRIAAGERLPAQPQPSGGSSHTRAETARLMRRVKKEPHWESMSAGELVRLLRCFGGLDLEHGDRMLRLHVSAARTGPGTRGD